jgi:hypothetical protein
LTKKIKLTKKYVIDNMHQQHQQSKSVCCDREL